MNVPPPPALPPLIVGYRENAICPSKLLSNHVSNIIQDCLSLKNELPKVCQRLLDSFPESVMLTWNRSVVPVLQEGPSCGLAAMCMVEQLVSESHSHLTLDEAISLAKSRQFTRYGEMFSAANMKSLICEVMKCEAELLNDGLDDKLKVINHLTSGQPALVPYDADKNNEPCCKRGHKAHWALLTGVALVVPRQFLDSCAPLLPDPNCERLYQMDDSNSIGANLSSLLSCGSVNINVLARQGKSRHLEIWNYDQLRSSNANLQEPSPTLDDEQWEMPKEGVKGGLCQKVILVSK